MMTAAVLESAVETCNDDPLVRSLTAVPPFESGEVICAEPTLQQDLQLAADCDVPVLVSGIRRSMGERVAWWIHRRSARRTAPFLVMDGRYRGVPAAVIAAMRRVQHGTLFMAHVDQLSPAMQVALLEFLERRGGEGLRLIAGSEGSVLQRVRNGQFREDLYYRLNLIHLRIE